MPAAIAGGLLLGAGLLVLVHIQESGAPPTVLHAHVDTAAGDLAPRLDRLEAAVKGLAQHVDLLAAGARARQKRVEEGAEQGSEDEEDGDNEPLPPSPPPSPQPPTPSPAAAAAPPPGRYSFTQHAPPAPAGCPLRDAQAAWFTTQMANGGSRPGACASGEWMRRLRDLDFARVVAAPAGATRVHRVVLDVGANKGYVLSELLGLWQPWRGVNPQFVKAALDAVPGSSAWEVHKCGVCSDCNEVLPAPDAPALARAAGLASPDEATARLRAGVHMSLYGVEPQPSNIGLLRAVQGSFDAARDDVARFAPGDAPTSLQLFHMGFSDHDFTGRFEERGPGDEGSSLGNENRGSGQLVDVPVVSADSFVAANVASSEADRQGDLSIMFVDTEGECPLHADGRCGLCWLPSRARVCRCARVATITSMPRYTAPPPTPPTRRLRPCGH